MAKEYIEERMGGLYLVGSRVSLDSIVVGFNQGMSAETIRENFPSLTLLQVYGAITYYLENRSDVDAYLVRQDELFERERAAAPPLPADLQRRLQAAREQIRTGRTGK